MSDILAAANGTDQRLDLILAELRALRADLNQAPVAVRQRLDALADDVAALQAEPGTIELREPVVPEPPAKRARR